MQPRQRHDFGHQRPSSSLPLPPPPAPPKVLISSGLRRQEGFSAGTAGSRRHQEGYNGNTMISKHHQTYSEGTVSSRSNQEGHNGGTVDSWRHQGRDIGGTVTSRRGNVQARFRTSPEPVNHDTGISTSRQPHDSFREIPYAHEHTSTIDVSYGNSFSRSPHPSGSKATVNYQSTTPANKSLTISPRNEITLTGFGDRERKQQRSSNPRQQTVSKNANSSQVCGAEAERQLKDHSKSQPDLEALLNRFEKYGGLENVLKSGLGKQHLSQSLRDAIELHGSTTELSSRRDLGARQTANSKRSIEERLDQGPALLKKSDVDERLDFRRDNFAPQAEGVGTEPSIQYAQKDTMRGPGNRGEYSQSRGYGGEGPPSGDDAFYGIQTRSSALRVRTQTLAIREQPKLDVRPPDRSKMSDFPQRRNAVIASDEVGNSNYTSGDFMLSKFRKHGVGEPFDDPPIHPPEFPVCGTSLDVLSRGSEGKDSNLHGRNVKTIYPLQISEGISHLTNEENQNLFLHESNEGWPGNIDVPPHYEPRREGKEMHCDFGSNEPSSYRPKLINEDRFIAKSHDYDTRYRSNVSLSLRSRLSASPHSKTNFDFVAVSDDITGPDHRSSTGYPFIQDQDHLSKRSTGASHDTSMASSGNIRERLEKSPVRTLNRSKPQRSRSPGPKARRTDTSADSAQRDANKRSLRNVRETKGKNQRSSSVSREPSRRLERTSPEKSKPTRYLGQKSTRKTSLSPRRKGPLTSARNRSRHSRSRSPIYSRDKVHVPVSGTPPPHARRSPVLRPRAGSSERLRKNSAGSLRNRSPERARQDSTGSVRKRSPGHARHETTGSLRQRSPGRVRHESAESLRQRSPGHARHETTGSLRHRSPGHARHETTGSLRQRSPGHVRQESAGSQRQRSPERVHHESTRHPKRSLQRLRERSPLRSELSSRRRLGAGSPVIATKGRARRSLSPQFSRPEFGRSPRLSSISPHRIHFSPVFDDLDHRFEAGMSPVQQRRRSWNSPTRPTRPRSFSSFEPAHLSPGPTYRRASPIPSLRSPLPLLSPDRSVSTSFPASSLRQSPLRWSPTRQACRTSATSQLRHHRSPKPSFKDSHSRGPPATFSKTSPLSKPRRRRSPGPRERVSPWRSQRSPQNPVTLRLTRMSQSTRVAAARREISLSPSRQSPKRLSLVLSRLSPRGLGSELLPSNVSGKEPSLDSPAKKATRSVKSPEVKQNTSRAHRSVRSPEDHVTGIPQRTFKSSLPPQSPRRKDVFDRLSSKDAASSVERSARSDKNMKVDKTERKKIPVKDRLGEKKIEEEIGRVELKVVDEVSVNTDSKNQDDVKNISSVKEAVNSNKKRPAPSPTEPVKKRKFVPIVFSAADFEKTSTSDSRASDHKRKRLSPRVDHKREQTIRKDPHLRQPRTSKNSRSSSNVGRNSQSHGPRNSDGKNKPTANKPTSRRAISSSLPAAKKDVKEMSVAELREEIAKFGGDMRAAKATTSREELRLLLLQAKEEEVEKKLRRLSGRSQPQDIH